MKPRIDPEQAIGYLLRFLSVEGTTGSEAAIGREIAAALEELGVPREAMRYDDAPSRMPVPTESGNLIVDLEGDPGASRRLFMAHRDTVPLCAGAVPKRDGDRIVPAGKTALGGDNRASVACLVSMVATLRRERIHHPPLTLLFTVREESGLLGARHVDLGLLGKPELAFNLDGASPSQLTVGAVGGSTWTAIVHGRAAHAGLAPERGISSTMVVAEALVSTRRRGFWGRIDGPSGRGTSNVGRLAGSDGGSVGASTNVVTDHARVDGEARSHDAAFVPRIVEAYRRAFEEAASSLPNDRGETASVEFRSEVMYEPFRLDPDSALVRYARRRGREIGLDPSLKTADGGLDANWMVRHGIPTLTFGTGQRNIHTVEEYVELSDYLDACRFSVALAAS